MGTEASREYFKNRPVDKPTPTFEGGKGKAGGGRGKGEGRDEEAAVLT